MADEYIKREAFREQEREKYCKGCARRKGKRNGKYKTLYEIGEAPCRACEIDDVLNDVEDFPAADVAPVRHGRNESGAGFMCSVCLFRDFGVFRGYKPNFCPNCGAKMDGGEA